VVIFEIILNGMAMFNHSNIYINPTVNKYLKYLFVTPSMHRIHHSIKISEYNTNYGFNLSLWDRLMGTYNENFKNKLILGLPNFRNLKYSKLHLFFGVIMIGFALNIILYIYELEDFWIIATYFFIIGSVDTFAMIFGKLIQGPKLAPVISPKKTICLFMFQ
jgi:CDP-diglyceride synthetase